MGRILWNACDLVTCFERPAEKTRFRPCNLCSANFFIFSHRFPAVDGVLFASMEDFIYCWENSSFDAMLRSHVVPWQSLKVERFFHFCLVYFVLFTFRASAFARYKICTTAVEPCHELIIRLADGPIVAFCLIGCPSFCMHVPVEFITHLHLFLYIILMHLGLLRFYLHV